MEQTHTSNPRAKMPVLLVIIGCLGDWCIRRVLKHAKAFEEESDKVTVVAIDLHTIEDIDKWITRRLIEQSAEDVDQPLRDWSGRALKGIDWGFTERLAINPSLPDPTEPGGPNPDTAIEQFVETLGPVFKAGRIGNRSMLKDKVESQISDYLEDLEEEDLGLPSLVRRWGFTQNIESLDEFKDAVVDYFVDQVINLADKICKRLSNDREELKEWLEQSISLLDYGECCRYWRSEKVNDDMLRSLAEKYRIIVYVATPPEAYPYILKQWSPYADRVAFEKPIAGLLAPVP